MTHESSPSMTATAHSVAFTRDGLRTLGLRHVAYIKPVTLLGRTGFAVHGADGTPLSVEESEIAAARFIFDQNLEPVRAH